MVQSIEGIRAYLQSDILANLSLLNQRNVHVSEARPDDDVAAEVSKRAPLVVEHGRVLDIFHVGRIAVEGWTKTCLDGTGYAWAQRGSSCKRSIAGLETNGITALQRNDGRELPSVLPAVPMERQLVD